MDLIGRPYWLPENIKLPQNKLKGRLETEIIIVGGSFAGLTAAYCLSKAGYAVSLVEASTIGYAASRSAGIVCSSLERDYIDYRNSYGSTTAQQIWDFSVKGVEFVSHLVKNLDSENKSQLEHTGSLYISYLEDRNYIKEEALARDTAGFATKYFDNKNNPFYEDDAHLGIFSPQDLILNPYTFCLQLAHAALSAGVTIYEGSPVIRVNKNECSTSEGSITAKYIILAGQDVPKSLGYGRRDLDILTFCLATAPLTPQQIAKIGLTDRQAFWDADQPFFYGRLTQDNRLIIGGNDLWKPLSMFGLQHVKLNRLEKRARERIALLQELSVDYRWGGSLTVLSDALPSVGIDNNVLIGGNAAGISQAVMVGKILAGLVVGEQEHFNDLLSHKRSLDLIPKMYSSKELFHMVMSLAGIF